MLETNNPMPYHFQIREVLKNEISEGRYKEKIPSERELIDRFSVSRTTIREAVNHLVNEGILRKVHGKGTFINQIKPIHEWLYTINSLTDTITRMGLEPGSKLLESNHTREPKHIGQHLESKDFHLIKRLRTADSEPIAIERHYHHPYLGEKLKKFDLDKITIYEVMENELEISMDEAEQSITCKPISAADAEQLEIEPNTNVLVVERLIRNSQGEAIEYYTSMIKPEMYVFRFTLQKQRG